MKKWKISTCDHFESTQEDESLYDEFLEYLIMVVRSGDLTAFDFQEVMGDETHTIKEEGELK